MPLHLLALYSQITSNGKLGKLTDTALLMLAKIDDAFETYEFFMDGAWKFRSDKLQKLTTKIVPEQK